MHVTDDEQERNHTFIAQMTTDNIVMWVAAQHCRLGLFQDSDFVGDLEDTRNQLPMVFCVFLEVEHLSPSVGCARNKRQCPTVPQSLKSFLWMLDCKIDGLHALEHWDVVSEVLRSRNNTRRPV